MHHQNLKRDLKLLDQGLLWLVEQEWCIIFFEKLVKIINGYDLHLHTNRLTITWVSIFTICSGTSWDATMIARDSRTNHFERDNFMQEK